MATNLLNNLLGQPEDSLKERLDKEPIVKKYWFNLGLSIILSLTTVIIGTIVIFQRQKHPPPVTHAYNLSKNTMEQVITLPYPHQSIKNLAGWLNDAMTTAYAFDFNHIDEQIGNAEYYFTATGYSMYLRALESSGVRDKVINGKLQITLVPIQDPILINAGSVGDTEFWRFRVPILTSYYGGKDPVLQKNLVEVLIIRVPAYKNQKGLAITEFNMTTL